MSVGLESAGLLDLLARGLGRAGEAGGRLVVSATVEVEADVDPSAVVCASRRAGDRWFCWEQPDRDGFALAALGSAATVEARGERRFGDVVEECNALRQRLVHHGPDDLPSGAGPVWTGGFAFDGDGGVEPQWASLPPALLVLPEVSLARTGGGLYLTMNVLATRERAERGLADARSRLASLRQDPLPMLDPDPVGRCTIASVLPPDRFEEVVGDAVGRIRGGGLSKVVLAREVVVEAARAHNPAAVYGALRELFPSCFCYCVGTGEVAFLGASPELLVRRAGGGVATVALAGSIGRSADPAVDDHLGERLLRSAKDREEHEIVARRIERILGRHAVWVSSEPDPALIKVANIQHLATPIHAQLAEPRSAIELAGLLHPTPAVGGEPLGEACRLIAELEAMDRGWYAGPVGWMDAAEDGELCVALRGALLRDRRAHLYAGVGVVGDSDPAAELVETEVKLQAMLPLLSG